MNDFDGYEYIGLNRRNNASVHGHPKIRVHPYSYAGATVYHTISIPPHSMTHINIPQSATLGQFGEYFKPRIFKNVVIVDCTEKQEILKKYLMTSEEDPLFGEKSEYPMLDTAKLKNGESTLLKILKDLEIDKQYIEEKIKETGKEMDDFDFIILRTDWFKFRFNTNTLSNMHFEMFHAFLLHPYLTSNTIKQILMDYENIIGIASDTSTLDNPISYVNPANAMPIIEKAYRIAFSRGMFRGASESISDDFLEGHLFDIDIRLKKDMIRSDTHFKYVLAAIFEREEVQLSNAFDINQKRDTFLITDGEHRYVVEEKGEKLSVRLEESKLRYFMMDVARLNHVQSDESITSGKLMLVPVRPLSEPTAVVCEPYFKKGDGR
jgi:kynurenine formamidase